MDFGCLWCHCRCIMATCATPVGDIDNGGLCNRGGKGICEIPAPSSQFCYKHRSVLKTSHKKSIDNSKKGARKVPD